MDKQTADKKGLFKPSPALKCILQYNLSLE